MKKRLLAMVIAAVMILVLVPVVFADGVAVAKVGEKSFETFAEALTAVKEAEEKKITLLQDAETGVFVDVGANAPSGLVVDLGGHTLTLNHSGGSAGTTTNGFRVLKNTEATVKNGTIVANFTENNRVKVAFANYGKLTLEGVEILHSGNMSADTGS